MALFCTSADLPVAEADLPSVVAIHLTASSADLGRSARALALVFHELFETEALLPPGLIGSNSDGVGQVEAATMRLLRNVQDLSRG